MLAIVPTHAECGADILAVEDLMQSLLSLHAGQAAKAALEHISSGGKRVRARLGLQSAASLGLDAPTAAAIGAAAAELVHNASLVHDDIQDRSEVRRGATTLWARHGRDVAICAGDLMISAAYGALAHAPGPHIAAAIARVHHRISEVIAGQSADLAARDAAMLSLFRYKEIAAAKSAPLIGLPVELSLILSGRGDHLPQVEQAASAFAIAYQMADDIEDAATDIENGEVNIIAILARDMPPEHAVSVARALVQKTYLLAADLACALPSESGALMTQLALQCARKVQDQPLSA